MTVRKITIRQDVKGPPYFEASCEFGVVAFKSKEQLIRSFEFVFKGEEINFTVELAEIEVRKPYSPGPCPEYRNLPAFQHWQDSPRDGQQPPPTKEK